MPQDFHIVTFRLSAKAYQKLVAVADELFPDRQRKDVAASLLKRILDDYYATIALNNGWTEGLTPTDRTALGRMENYLVCLRKRNESAKESAAILKTIHKPDSGPFNFDD